MGVAILCKLPFKRCIAWTLAANIRRGSTSDVDEALGGICRIGWNFMTSDAVKALAALE